jgi:rRNA maturation endonuclease Nob1
MSTEPNQEDTQNIDNPNDTGTKGTSSTSNSSADPVEKLVESRVQEALKDIKTKLDKAYSVRDEALKKAAELEQVRKQEEIRRLQEAGKDKEALELQLAEEKAQRMAHEKRVVELTRDMELRNALGTYSFRNENAFSMAYREIVDQLTQDDKGLWKHKSGVSLKDYVRQFAEDAENAFLLKQKVSSGTGSSTVKTTESSGNGGKSIFSMSQDEVLKLAREGKLRK